jgi:hypothetical protein
VAVTKIEGLPEWHHCGSLAHLISKQAPQLSPLLNKAVLRAAVFTPYPWLYRFPYPQAPPVEKEQKRKKKKLLFEREKVHIFRNGYFKIGHLVLEMSHLSVKNENPVKEWTFFLEKQSDKTKLYP